MAVYLLKNPKLDKCVNCIDSAVETWNALGYTEVLNITGEKETPKKKAVKKSTKKRVSVDTLK